VTATVQPVPLRRTVLCLPHSPGVYRFRDARGTVLYLGRATDLRSRVGSYWSSLRGRRHLAAMVARIDRVEAVACDSVAEATWLERNLLERSLPRWNRTRGGQETPVYLRLDPRPRSPGLGVVHTAAPADDAEGVQYFGPYLGGERARQTVSALHRVLPLAHAGTLLRGAQLDLARTRGVAPIDARALADAVAAVLQRSPEAVARARADLVAARERACTAMAFELADRIQAEIEALEWTTAPQRVTGPAGSGPLEVYGWCDGILVQFGIHHGRLDTWSQRRCGRPLAAARLAATPADWVGFAQRAAELAAALALPDEESGRS
jgi:excinuclease ABC subunit C